MNKQTQNSTQLFSIGLLTMCLIAMMALFFSSCKKKKEPPPVPIVAETFYTVTFNSNGGSTVSAIKVKKGNSVTLPVSPTKTDFVFGGWFTDDKTFKNQFDAKTLVNSDLTLYAKWNENEVYYTVSFDSKGGSAIAAIQVKKGNTVTLPAAPTKAGYTFDGWYTDKEASATPFVATTPITANLTLYAKWNENEVYYTVSFDSKGGSAVAAIQVKKGNTVTLPAAPTKAGYTFGGWYTDSQASATPFVATTPITANLTLYAKWNENEVYYTVSFDSKGGSAVAAIQVKKGNTVTLPAAPTKAGYTFGGWYTDKEASATPFVTTTVINANLILYAKWNAVGPSPLPFVLGSTSFRNGGEIPSRYAYPTNSTQTDRLNISPQLSWANAPAATTSFLIIMDDTTVPSFNHWTVYNIPASRTSLEENDPWLPTGPVESTPGRYCGPFPNPGSGRHTYKITIFALNLPITHFNSANFPKSEMEANELGAHILAIAFITGTFEVN